MGRTFATTRRHAPTAAPRPVIWAATAFLLTFLLIATVRAEEEVGLTSLDWVPYTGEYLHAHGAVSAAVSEAFARAGINVRFGFWPWNRAILNAWHGGKDYVGYFPGYHCRHKPDADFIASSEIGRTPLGFVYDERGGKPAWNKLSDLAGKRIGYVTGYASTDEFERLEKSGELSVFRSADDRANIVKLGRGELDVILIDKFVFEYLLHAVPEFRDFQDRLRFDPKYLEDKSLYVCFRNDETGRRYRRLFDAGLARAGPGGIIAEYLGKAFGAGAGPVNR